MVNKAFLSLAAVVLFAVFGTGVLVGMQVGGLGSDAPEPVATETGATATPTATAAPATETPEPEPTPTSAPVEDSEDETIERESIPPREFNERNISVAIIGDINDARAAEGLDRLSTTGTTAQEVQAMASSHSEAMAEAGLVRHTIDGTTSVDRYERDDLYTSCQFQVESYIEKADDNSLEVVGRTYAGQTYPDSGTQQFNEDDEAVATALTDEWLSTQRQRLVYKNADRIGVGVTLTSTGVVYATVNIC